MSFAQQHVTPPGPIKWEGATDPAGADPGEPGKAVANGLDDCRGEE